MESRGNYEGDSSFMHAVGGEEGAAGGEKGGGRDTSRGQEITSADMITMQAGKQGLQRRLRTLQPLTQLRIDTSLLSVSLPAIEPKYCENRLLETLSFLFCFWLDNRCI